MSLKARRRIQAKRKYAVRKGNLKKLNSKWKRPFGRHSKIRLHRAGYAKHPTLGDRSPKETIGLNQFGLKEVRIHNSSEIDKVKEGEVILIGSTVGAKKRAEIISLARKRKIRVMNK